jgi:hypothetical protein
MWPTSNLEYSRSICIQKHLFVIASSYFFSFLFDGCHSQKSKLYIVLVFVYFCLYQLLWHVIAVRILYFCICGVFQPVYTEIASRLARLSSDLTIMNDLFVHFNFQISYFHWKNKAYIFFLSRLYVSIISVVGINEFINLFFKVIKERGYKIATWNWKVAQHSRQHV